MAKKDASDNKFREEVGKSIVAELQDEVFGVEGTPMVTMKLKDGTYKQKPAVPGAEFTLIDTYVGKRNQLIFVFDPVDAQDFLIEVDKKMEDIFPTFSVSIQTAMENLTKEDLDEDLTTYQLVDRLVAKQKLIEQENLNSAEAKEKKRIEDVYVNHPLFGRF